MSKKKVAELRKAKLEVVDKMKAITSAAEKRENKSMTQEELTEFNTLEGEVRRYNDEIKVAERMDEIEEDEVRKQEESTREEREDKKEQSL